MDRLLIVAVLLAGLAAVALLARRRGRAERALPARVNPTELGLDPVLGDTAVVAFSGPLCHACQQWGEELSQAGIPYRKIDVLQEAGLARAYGVTSTPVVLVVERESGDVLAGWDDAPDADSVARVRELALV